MGGCLSAQQAKHGILRQYIRYLDPGGALLVLLDQLVVQLALARGHAQLLHQAGLRRQVSQYLDKDV